jgi:TPR repeat protein
MPVDETSGEELLRRASEADTPPVLALLQRAWALEQAPPQSRDVDRITSLYSQASELGDAVAMYHAGISSMSGSGCEKDSELAFELLKASSDQGFLHAKFASAIFHGADADVVAAKLGGEQMEVKRAKGLLIKPRTPKPRASVPASQLAK